MLMVCFFEKKRWQDLAVLFCFQFSFKGKAAGLFFLTKQIVNIRSK